MLWESLCSGSHYALGVIMLWESLCSGSHYAIMQFSNSLGNVTHMLFIIRI